MAWETRHVKIPVLNDSQYIGMNIYNVVLSSITGVALSTLLNDKPTLCYMIVSTLIVLSTTSLLCLLFLPKVRITKKNYRFKLLHTPKSYVKTTHYILFYKQLLCKVNCQKLFYMSFSVF